MTSSDDASTTGLLDTSVFVALEAGRELDVERLPFEAAVSIVTIAELRVGVLMASDPAARASRLSTYTRALEFDPITIDETVAAAWADLRLRLAVAKQRMTGNDSWIAATAIAHGIPVVTQDDDFIEGLGYEVIRI